MSVRSLTRPSSLIISVTLVCAWLLAGCADGSPPGTPSAAGLPLATGARIVARARQCNRGAHPFCALELVVSAPSGQYPAGSQGLLSREQGLLHRHGWQSAAGDTVAEQAAESPGHRMRVTYATALDDLQSIEAGTIVRAPTIARALSGRLYARVPTLSVIVQAGSA